ncbi:MAG: hypothetical protein M3450_10535 [Actinomycetota bacterium]|nr:hypothetical protein [Actinomycetota bacterium]
MEAADRWKYGLIAVGMGLAVICLCFGVAVWKYEAASDAGAVLAAVTGTVGTIVGAYFGVQAGSAGKEKAEDNALDAQKALGKEKDKAQALAGALPEGAAQTVLQRFI